MIWLEGLFLLLTVHYGSTLLIGTIYKARITFWPLLFFTIGATGLIFMECIL